MNHTHVFLLLVLKLLDKMLVSMDSWPEGVSTSFICETEIQSRNLEMSWNFFIVSFFVHAVAIACRILFSKLAAVNLIFFELY